MTSYNPLVDTSGLDAVAATFHGTSRLGTSAAPAQSRPAGCMFPSREDGRRSGAGDLARERVGRVEDEEAERWDGMS